MPAKLKIPTKLTPDTIVETVVELRFQTKIPKEQVFGLLVKTLVDDFPKYKGTNIPGGFKIGNAAFSHLVEGTLLNDKFSIGIGSSAITFNNSTPYKGWDSYLKMMKDCLMKIEKLKIISKFDRLGLRYINFFEGVTDITEHLNININFTEKGEYKTTQTIFNTRIAKNGFNNRLAVSDNLNINNKVGAVIDIDTSTNEIPFNIEDKLFDLINKGHNEEKYLFFSLLKPTFLKKYKPQY